MYVMLCMRRHGSSLTSSHHSLHLTHETIVNLFNKKASQTPRHPASYKTKETPSNPYPLQNLPTTNTAYRTRLLVPSHREPKTSSHPNRDEDKTFQKKH